MIIAGRVLANEQKVTKPGTTVDDAIAIRLLGDENRFVSRGGIKLQHALEHWNITLSGRPCMDVGASTGGFTDCMLQNGAESVLAVDTGYGQIDAKLRADPRVTLLEKTNARYLEASQVKRPVSFIAMDVSFISATLVLPAVVNSTIAGRRGELVLLIKPQFEVGKENVGKGGIVKDEAAQLGAVSKVKAAIEELGGEHIEVIDSPIRGTEGNREFLLHCFFNRKQQLDAGNARV